MPVWYSPIDELATHVIYPVAKQFAHNTVNDLALASLIQDRIYISTGWTGTKSSRVNHTASIWKDNVKIEVTPAYAGSPKWDANSFTQYSGHGIYRTHLNGVYPTVFRDDDANITLREMILPMTLNFQIQFQIKDRNRAYRLPSQILRRYTTGVVYTQSLTYDYPLPSDIITMVYSLYKLRRLDKKPTFRDYIKSNSKDRISYAIHRTNDGRGELVVNKYIMNALVSYEYSEEKPQETKSNELSYGYNINLTATLQFQCTDEMLLEYPCMIDNQLLPAKMITTIRNDEDIVACLDGTHPNRIYDQQIKGTKGYATDSPVVCPFYDDFDVPMGERVRRSYKPFYTAMLLTDETNEYTEIPLNTDLGDDYVLHPIIIKMLKKQKRESFKLDVLFNITCYSDNRIYSPESMELSDDLVLRIRTKKNIQRPKRIVLSELCDMAYLNPKWYPDVIEDWPFYKVSDQIQDAIDKGLIPDLTEDDIHNHYPGGGDSDSGGTKDDINCTLRIIKGCIISRRSKHPTA